MRLKVNEEKTKYLKVRRNLEEEIEYLDVGPYKFKVVIN